MEEDKKELTFQDLVEAKKILDEQGFINVSVESFFMPVALKRMSEIVRRFHNDASNEADRYKGKLNSEFNYYVGKRVAYYNMLELLAEEIAQYRSYVDKLLKFEEKKTDTE